MNHNNSTKDYIGAGVLIGIGMGGFVDGIVLHQILQWHEMLSAKIPTTTIQNKSINMFWDGIFHLFTWVITAIGIRILWKSMKSGTGNPSGTLLVFSMIFGWGLFNFIEGIIDHYIFNIHNVREVTENPSLYNHGFLIFSIVQLIVGGYYIFKSRKKERQSI